MCGIVDQNRLEAIFLLRNYTEYFGTIIYIVFMFLTTPTVTITIININITIITIIIAIRQPLSPLPPPPTPRPTPPHSHLKLYHTNHYHHHHPVVIVIYGAIPALATLARNLPESSKIHQCIFGNMPLSSKCTMHFRWSFIFSTLWPVLLAR